jgi:hypothetical protein
MKDRKYLQMGNGKYPAHHLGDGLFQNQKERKTT